MSEEQLMDLKSKIEELSDQLDRIIALLETIAARVE